MTLGVLKSGDVARVMAAYEVSLARHREVLNRLNVYPVPDGDTGTNMHLTLESVGRELASLDMPRSEYASAPTWQGTDAQAIGDDAMIRVALARR